MQWWSAEPERLSPAAVAAIEQADQLAVAAITWYELAWLAAHLRITVDVPVRTWLDDLHQELPTIPITPAIAATAVSLPPDFPSDPADRLIFATAVETGSKLLTKDGRLRRHPTALW